MTDARTSNPKADPWQDWRNSPEGAKCADISELRFSKNAEAFLEGRLLRAFDAGFAAGKRFQDETSGDAALTRNALGNLYVAVERLGRRPEIPLDADTVFAMREAAQLLGPPYSQVKTSGDAT